MALIWLNWARELHLLICLCQSWWRTCDFHQYLSYLGCRLRKWPYQLFQIHSECALEFLVYLVFPCFYIRNQHFYNRFVWSCFGLHHFHLASLVHSSFLWNWYRGNSIWLSSDCSTNHDLLGHRHHSWPFYWAFAERSGFPFQSCTCWNIWLPLEEHIAEWGRLMPPWLWCPSRLANRIPTAKSASWWTQNFSWRTQDCAKSSLSKSHSSAHK